MNNSMPSMPSLPSQNFNESSSGEAKVSQAPFTDDSVVSAAESDVALDVPSHVEEDPFKAPEIQVSQQPPSNEVKISAPVPKSGIKVVATRKGFYNQMRYKEGDQFSVRSEEELGEWMKCVDSFYEKKRIELLKSKKLKAK